MILQISCSTKGTQEMIIHLKTTFFIARFRLQDWDLIIDKEKGNLVKVDRFGYAKRTRFGYVKRAMHGTKMLSNKAVMYI